MLSQSTATNALLIDLRLTVLTAAFQRAAFFYISFVFIFCGINKIYHARIRGTKTAGVHKKAGNIYCLELASNERYANEIV